MNWVEHPTHGLAGRVLARNERQWLVGLEDGTERFYQGGLLEERIDDAQALADVRTLDADDPNWAMAVSPTGHYCILPSRIGNGRQFWAETPDAARHAAAEWVRTETRARAAIEKADRILDAHAREQTIRILATCVNNRG